MYKIRWIVENTLSKNTIKNLILLCLEIIFLHINFAFALLYFINKKFGLEFDFLID